MTDLWTIASWATGAVCASWILFIAFATIRVARAPRIRDEDLTPVETLPRLSVIVPACNEADTIEKAVRSLLAQPYEDMQVVLIDDRSTDDTPRLVDELAAGDDRVIPLHIEELPAGWLGKIHALQRGIEHADGDWLLIADADVEYRDDALSRIVSFAERSRFQHVGLIPEIQRNSFAHDALVESFAVMLVAQIPMHDLEGSDRFFGVGAFNLVRRDFYETTPGFEWLRMEIADDMGFGLMVKENGGRTYAATAKGLLYLNWYRSAFEMVRGMEKNIFAAMAHFSVARAVAIAVAVTVVIASPLLGLLLPAPFGWPLALATLLSPLPLGLLAWRRWGSNPLAVMAMPLGLALLVVGVVRSTFLYLRDGGVSWRGTFYSTEELRSGQRVKL